MPGQQHSNGDQRIHCPRSRVPDSSRVPDTAVPYGKKPTDRENARMGSTSELSLVPLTPGLLGGAGTA